jgi:hypothetical protein
MKTHTRARLARLEAEWVNSVANQNDLRWYEFKSAIMAIVAFHVGELAPQDSLATALARALGMTAGELKSALDPNNDDGQDIWPLLLEKLNNLAAARGGRPITENGSLTVERSRQDDDRRNSLDVFDELYGELPEGIKEERRHLLPYLADYLL